MNVTKNQLRQLITEVLKEAWPDDVRPESEWASGPIYQLNDMLVSHAQREIYAEANRAGRIGTGPGQITENDLAFEHEESLMDHMLPLAEQFADTLWPAYMGHLKQYMSEDTPTDVDSDEDEEYTMLPTPKTDPMSRPPSPQRKRAMAHFEKTVGPDWLKESLAEVLDTLEEG
jgi:hypothetical protein